jgi:shikimate kinase
MSNKDLIFLIGFMGSGKSTVGKLLAEKLAFNFIDTDDVIEQRAGMSINVIFEKYGETHFRKLETALLKEICLKTKAVVSTGGGLPIYNDNIALINQHGTSVYLSIAPNRILKRLENSEKRPLIKNKTVKEITVLLHKRRPIYMKADFNVMASRPSTAVVNRICTLLKF